MAGVEPEERVRPGVTQQRWRTLTFLHWSYDPAVVAGLLPPDLEPDVYDGRAWVGLTPFRMEEFRLSRLRPIPGVASFPETNVRTYVRDPDGRDGIWFFSLEVDNFPLFLAARTLYGVPYRWADMSIDGGPTTTITYRSRRRSGEASPPGHHIVVRPDAPIPDGGHDERDDWLTGRWRAWTRIGRRLATVAVEHERWPLWRADVVHLEQTLTAAAGLPPPEGDPVVLWTPGVHDVRLDRPRLLSPPGPAGHRRSR